MHSQLNYQLARDELAARGVRAERVRQMRDGAPVREGSRGSRLLRRWFGGVGGDLEQRELPLAPDGLERAPVAAGCLELE
jgi:hypothetical protein